MTDIFSSHFTRTLASFGHFHFCLRLFYYYYFFTLAKTLLARRSEVSEWERDSWEMINERPINFNLHSNHFLFIFAVPILVVHDLPMTCRPLISPLQCMQIRLLSSSLDVCQYRRAYWRCCDEQSGDTRDRMRRRRDKAKSEDIKRHINSTRLFDIKLEFLSPILLV